MRAPTAEAFSATARNALDLDAHLNSPPTPEILFEIGAGFGFRQASLVAESPANPGWMWSLQVVEFRPMRAIDLLGVKLLALAAASAWTDKPLGAANGEISYSGYAEIPCSWRSMPYNSASRRQPQ